MKTEYFILLIGNENENKKTGSLNSEILINIKFPSQGNSEIYKEKKKKRKNPSYVAETSDKT